MDGEHEIERGWGGGGGLRIKFSEVGGPTMVDPS